MAKTITACSIIIITFDTPYWKPIKPMIWFVFHFVSNPKRNPTYREGKPGPQLMEFTIVYHLSSALGGTAYNASCLLARCHRWRLRGGCQRWKFFRPSEVGKPTWKCWRIVVSICGEICWTWWKYVWVYVQIVYIYIDNYRYTYDFKCA